MTEKNFWDEVGYENQIREAEESIKHYQDIRKFGLGLLIAVFGLGSCINLLTSLLYDGIIKRETVPGASFWFVVLCLVISALLVSMYVIYSKYAPVKPLLRLDLNPMEWNDYLQEMEPKLNEILNVSEKEVIGEISELFKNRIDDRPPIRGLACWELKDEILGNLLMAFSYEGSIYARGSDIKSNLEITFGRAFREFWLNITIQIMKPGLSGSEAILDKSIVFIIIQDIMYALEMALKQFIESDSQTPII